MKHEKDKRLRKKIISMSIVFALSVSLILFFIYRQILISIIGLFLTLVIIFLYFYFSKALAKSSRIKKIESVFPDFLQLMSSNLKAGMTIDRAMLLSSRPEFAPLDAEILNTGKDITTGKDIEQSFLDMSKRIGAAKETATKIKMKYIATFEEDFFSNNSLCRILVEVCSSKTDKSPPARIPEIIKRIIL